MVFDRKEYDRIRSQNLKQIGKCTRHCNNDVVPGKTICQKCRDNKKISDIKLYEGVNKNRKNVRYNRHNLITRKEYFKELYKTNKERIIERNKKYNKTEQGKLTHKIKDNKRREAKNNVIHMYTKEEWNEKVKQSNGICLKKYGGCGKEMKLTLDHIYPLKKANEDFLKIGIKRVYTIDDVVPLCKSCNSKKSTSLIT